MGGTPIAVVHNPGGRQDETFFPTAHENMIFYANDISNAIINKLPASEEKLKQYKLQDKYGKYKLRGFRRSGNNSRRIDRPGLFYPIYADTKNKVLSLEEIPNSIKLLPIDESGIERCWRWGKDTFAEKKEKYIELKDTKSGFDLYIKERECDYEGEKAKTIWDKPHYTGQTASIELKKIFGDKVFSYPKSVYLMVDVLGVATNKDDIILDFFSGSGTTAQAVLELNKRDDGHRKFILCEQMDYVENITLERVKKVLHKLDLNDTIVYCEFAKLNQKYVDAIQLAKNEKELWNIWSEIRSTGFINCLVSLKEINEAAEDYQALSFEDKKKIFMTILDKNMLYVNLCDIDDEEFTVSEQDKIFTRSFYRRV